MRRATIVVTALAFVTVLGGGTGCEDTGAGEVDRSGSPEESATGEDEVAEETAREEAVLPDPVPGAPRRPAGRTVAREAAQGPADGGLPVGPREESLRVEIRPPSPRPGEAFEIRGGPITFRNGCEGIESVELERQGDRIQVGWRPRQVPPDAVCTMALHDEWVTAEVPGLPAGRYLVVVDQVGSRPVQVGP